jgi:disulfide bond formation protein DsbB
MNATKASSAPDSGQSGWLMLFACWLLASTATLGSLFFSEAMGIEPCSLCWYQRIFMYPLVVILLVGMFPLDPRVVNYALPFAVIGWGVSVFHYLLYSGYIPENVQPCGEGVSCTEISLELLGFITIPMLSLLSFTMIVALLMGFRKWGNR